MKKKFIGLKLRLIISEKKKLRDFEPQGLNKRGFEPQDLNQRGYSQICFNWVRVLTCFLHN